MREDQVYIDDIIDCLTKIEKYTKRLNADSFADDDKTIDAVCRNLEIVGEAVET